MKISTDMGNSWPFNPNYSFPGGGINAVGFSPNYANDNTISVATGASSAGGGLYESNDKGVTWERISRELISNWWTDESLEAISISPNFHSDNTLFTTLVDGFAGTIGIWRTTDNGTNWDYLLLDIWGGGTTGLTNRGISSMVISPDFLNDNTLFLGTAVGVYVSTDQAESWSAINNGLENLSIETMVISPNFSKDKTLFVGTHSGIFKSTNGGTSWAQASTGLPGSTLVNVSNDPYAVDTLPSIAADKNGAVHVIWMGTHDSSESPDGVATDVMYTKKIGDTFEEPIMITVPTEYYSKELSLAVDNDGFVHIAFLRMEDQLGASGDLYYVNNKNGSFGNPQLVVGDGWWEYAYRPAIAVDYTG